MAIKDIEYFYGVVLLRLVNEGIPVSLRPLNYETKGIYLINETVPLLIKYTSKKPSPWSFSFSPLHQDDFQKAKDEYGSAFLAFVCGQDGICCIEFDQFKFVLDHVHGSVEWVRISRRKNECYKISGADGELKNKISDSDFPKIILSKLAAKKLEGVLQSPQSV